MKIYNIEMQGVYSAKVKTIVGHEDRAIIIAQSDNTEYFPCETEGYRMDASVLLSECMGFDPEKFDEKSEEVRRWVEEWSYPVEMANAIVAQLNHK